MQDIRNSKKVNLRLIAMNQAQKAMEKLKQKVTDPQGVFCLKTGEMILSNKLISKRWEDTQRLVKEKEI